MIPRVLLACLVLLATFPRAAGGQARPDFVAELVARSFVRALLEGDAPTALGLCAERVSMDGEWAQGRAAIEAQILAMQGRVRTFGLKLQHLAVLPHAEVVRRFGPPPERLRGVAGPGRLVALARLNTLGVAIILGRAGGLWKVVGLSD